MAGAWIDCPLSRTALSTPGHGRFQRLEGRALIATENYRAYLARMSIARLLRLLAILAMLFAPLGMMGGHAAMAMPAQATQAAMDHGAMMDPGGHCADREKQSHDRKGASIDCMIACSAMPTAELRVEDRPSMPAIVEPAAPANGLRGLHPESDPPPPRFS